MLRRTRQTTARLLRGMARRTSALAHRVDAGHWQPSRQDLALVSANSELKNLHAGQPAFVLGNGPSLATQNLRPLANQITFAANGFWRHPLMAEAEERGEDGWQPTYYSMIDPLYFDGSEPMKAALEIIRRRARRCTFLVPVRSLAAIHEQGYLPADRLRACLLGGHVASGAEWSCDLSRALPLLQSVSLMGLLSALYTGCNPIYMLGMDHDWLSQPVIRCEHFYAEVSVEGHPTFEAIERGGSETYLENMEGMSTLYRSYHGVLELACRMGVAIYNATPGGYLDVFPRVAYESVVPQPPPPRNPSPQRRQPAVDKM